MKVALIGGGGRSARALRLLAGDTEPGLTFRSIVRRKGPDGDEADEVVAADYADITPATFGGCDAVINFVGTVREANEEELVRVNAEVAVHAAAAARAAGVAQFIQLSSLAVYGQARQIDAASALAPVDAYGRSKLAAEQGLLSLAANGFTVTLLRVPAIYGKARPSKLASLAAALRLIRIFPVAAPLARRSIISERNLASSLIHLLRHPKAGAVLAADPQPFRIDTFARLLPFKTWLVPLPAALFAPVRWAAPKLHASLFASSEIAEGLLLRTEPPLAATEASLSDAFRDG